MKHGVRITVEGRVQGVGFRWFVQQRAQRIGVVGHVRNLASGSVEIEAEGSREQLNELQAAVSSGPAFSKIANLVVEEKPPTGEYDAFEITF